MNLFIKHLGEIERATEYDEAGGMTDTEEAAKLCEQITRTAMKEFADWAAKNHFYNVVRDLWFKDNEYNQTGITTEQLLDVYLKEKEEEQ